jgi:MoaA/NifB/PqqE/SkfB family radical SAM enzyme
MDMTEKGIEALKSEIKKEIKAIYELNMTIEGWNVPEMDEKKAKVKILKVMQEALDELKTKE